MHEPRQLSVHDIVAFVCTAFGLAMVAAVLAACAASQVDYSKVPRAQLTRAESGCTASFPLVARAEFADDLQALLRASGPWSSAADRVTVVPAVEGESDNLRVTILPCPDALVRKDGSCAHLAETWGACEAGAWRQEIRLYVVDEDLNLTLMHELGHALGVDLGCDKWGHSCAPWSIMFHTIDDRNALMSFSDSAGPDAEMHGPYQWVRPADAAALRRAWGLR
jgi:hypothetical protein